MKNNLQYVPPESLGIPSKAVSGFLNTLHAEGINMHGFMVLRHGKVAAEGYWAPFKADDNHRMYSISKSFTSVAIGMLIDAGKLTLDSKPAEIFSEYLPEAPHHYVLEATVEDLLKMATFNSATSYTFTSSDWTETFFTDKGTKHKPGQVFNYDTAATTVLCAIVEKISGKPILEFMRPVLDVIGFSQDIKCVQTVEGRSWTGSGILCTHRDLARFALLCMNMGAWNGKQLISESYMRAATSKQIDTAFASFSGGYGYQFWCLNDGGFAMFGMGGQLALCSPKHAFALITTADTQHQSEAISTMVRAYDTLLAQLSDETLPKNIQDCEALNTQIEKLHIALPHGKKYSPAMNRMNKTYQLEDNPLNMKWMRVVADENRVTLEYMKNTTNENTEDVLCSLTFGLDAYVHQLFPEKYAGLRIGTVDRHYRCIAAGTWLSENTFYGILYSIDDHLGSIRLQLTFEDDEICGIFTKNAENFFNDYQGFISGKT